MPAPSLDLPAPAKLNLFLHVTGRRGDGYHTLESLFVALDLCDRVRLTRRDDRRIARAIAVPGVDEDDDLTVRAARRLQTATGAAAGVDIALDKRIPVGGGLGGGSSDAATTLLGLNRLWNLGLSRPALRTLGAELGADVPFFLGPGASLARGIGEVLTPVTVPRYWIALLAPPIHVATASMFAARELTRDTTSAKINVFSEGYGRNDLQSVAAARFPAIAQALGALSKHSAMARMTGSGGCVFAPFGTRAQADAAVASAIMAVPGARGFVTRLLAQHPLAAFA